MLPLIQIKMALQKRRDFIKTTVAAGAGLAIAPSLAYIKPEIRFKRTKPNGKLFIAFIGVGNRGSHHLSLVSKFDNVEIPAICDIDPAAISKSQKILRDHSRKDAAVYSGDDYAFMKMLDRDDIDGVIIATPWRWHTPMAVASMRAGKYPGVEVSAANTIEECWDLVNTSEETGMPLMILENVCFAREAMTVLNMVRKGLWGELVHASCGYQHDLRELMIKFDNTGEAELNWRTLHALKRNGDLYPTHGVGPVATWLDINHGNRFETITSVATKATGLHRYIEKNAPDGENNPAAKLKWKLGDIVTSTIKTARGETISISYDTNLPRPYSWGFTLHGNEGIWAGQYEGKKIYIDGKSPEHQWETGTAYDKYMNAYDHKIWREEEAKAKSAGHGGIDYFTIKTFLESVRNEIRPPIDVYDAAAWSAVTPLSEASVATNGTPQYFPDFTRGRWITNKPKFGLE
jgi:predicted dehydrogenase